MLQAKRYIDMAHSTISSYLQDVINFPMRYGFTPPEELIAFVKM